MGYLLLHGRLPERAERLRFAQDLAERRMLPRAALEILREAARALRDRVRQLAAVRAQAAVLHRV